MVPAAVELRPRNGAVPAVQVDLLVAVANVVLAAVIERIASALALGLMSLTQSLRP
jgi:hypothetical protein